MRFRLDGVAKVAGNSSEVACREAHRCSAPLQPLAAMAVVLGARMSKAPAEIVVAVGLAVEITPQAIMPELEARGALRGRMAERGTPDPILLTLLQARPAATGPRFHPLILP